MRRDGVFVLRGMRGVGVGAMCGEERWRWCGGVMGWLVWVGGLGVERMDGSLIEIGVVVGLKSADWGVIATAILTGISHELVERSFALFSQLV